MARSFFLLTVVVIVAAMIGCGKPPAKTASELGIAGMNQFELAAVILAEEERIADLAKTDLRAARKAADDLKPKMMFFVRGESAWNNLFWTFWDEKWALKISRRDKEKWEEQWRKIRASLEVVRKRMYPPEFNCSVVELDAEFHKRIPDMFRIVTDYPLVYQRANEAEMLCRRARVIHEVADNEFVTWVAEGVSRRAHLNIDLSWEKRLAPTFQIDFQDERRERVREHIRGLREQALQYWEKNYERHLPSDAVATCQ